MQHPTLTGRVFFCEKVLDNIENMFYYIINLEYLF